MYSSNKKGSKRRHDIIERSKTPLERKKNRYIYIYSELHPEVLDNCNYDRDDRNSRAFYNINNNRDKSKGD